MSMAKKQVLKMENICRTCLRSPKKLVSFQSDANLINKIETISSIQISSEDKIYPTTICEDCINNINKSYCFRKIIINSDRELKERYAAIKAKIKAEPENEYNFKFFNELDNKDYDEFSTNVAIKIENLENTARKKLTRKRKSSTPTCTDCNLTFLNRIKLESHRRTVHAAPGICNICGIVVRQDNLKKHVQTHSGEAVICKICGKTLKNAESLRGHLLIHRGIVYTCEICNRTFRVKAEYSRHIKIHKDPDIRKVMCSICGKKVREIKKHILSHTGECPYNCIHCGKGFKSTYALKIHTRQHTNEKPFICEYCSMSFYQKTSLHAHLKSKHDIQTK